MSRAFRCDECGDFHEGQPAISVSLSLDVNGAPNGMLGQLFSSSDGGETLDLCGVECYQAADLNGVRDEMLAELENKNELLNAESGANPSAALGGDT